MNNISEDVMIQSFNPSLNHKIFKGILSSSQAGKSGKNIIMTHDKRFILKELDKSEKTTLFNMSKNYLAYLDLCPKSLLSKIYGLFSLKLPEINKVYVIIMQNFDFFSES